MGLISRVSSRTYREVIKMTEKYADLKEHVEKVGFHHYDYDPRFRQTNRSRECAWNYTDYFRCMRVLGDRGDDTTPCQWFKKQYFRVCKRTGNKCGMINAKTVFSGERFINFKIFYLFCIRNFPNMAKIFSLSIKL